MDEYPVAVIQDRYSGSYSGGAWLAIARCDETIGRLGPSRIVFCLTEGPHGGDGDAMAFWSEPAPWIAVGNTPDEALAALRKRHDPAD
jgi:hypothetical protein